MARKRNDCYPFAKLYQILNEFCCNVPGSYYVILISVWKSTYLSQVIHYEIHCNYNCITMQYKNISS